MHVCAHNHNLLLIYSKLVSTFALSKDKWITDLNVNKY